MGFGTLFLGYILLFICRGADVFPDTAAYILIFLALRTLTAHSEYFKGVKLTLFALLPIGVATDIVQLTAAFTEWQPGLLQTTISALNAVALLVFHILLFGAIRRQATELDLKGIAYRASRNLYVTIFYYALTLLTIPNPPFIADIMKYLGIFYILLGIVWLVLNATLIYSCYMRICLEGDEDMPERGGIWGKLNRAAGVDVSEEEARELASKHRGRGAKHKKKK